MGNQCTTNHTAEDQNKVQETNENPISVRHLPVFDQPARSCGVATTGGRLYLANDLHVVVDVVDPVTGARISRYGTFQQQGHSIVGHLPQFTYPDGLAVDERRGVLYVVDQGRHCVVVVRLNDGMVEAVWGSEGTGLQQFLHPCGVAYCPTTDLLYVADRANHRVKVLRGSDGECVQVLGTGQGSGSHHMDGPQGVAVDARHVYIADFYNHRVLVYAKQSGEFLCQIGQKRGSGDTQFEHPVAVSVDSKAGVVYVADSENYRVCVYRSDGSYVRHFQVLQADNTRAKPTAVMWDAAGGVLYVTIENSSTICVYECRIENE